MICIDRLIGQRVAGEHEFRGAVEGVVLGGFVSERRSGDMAMGELVLVVMLDEGSLCVVDADGARRVPARPAGPSGPVRQ